MMSVSRSPVLGSQWYCLSERSLAYRRGHDVDGCYIDRASDQALDLACELQQREQAAFMSGKVHEQVDVRLRCVISARHGPEHAHILGTHSVSSRADLRPVLAEQSGCGTSAWPCTRGRTRKLQLMASSPE
jgi:hypothetical protein